MSDLTDRAPAVSLEGLSKRYRVFHRQRDRIKEAMSFGAVRKSQDFWALRNVDLEVQRGTTLGIVGQNGAGKTTLLKMVSGVLQPTLGSVQVHGRVVALLELGAGFNPEFTGRENAALYGLILGIDRATMRDRFDEIQAFADIGQFFDQPVKTYSSGMQMRVAFAVAVNVEPDVLVIDEALAVGDAAFAHLCMQRMRKMQEDGMTILLSSHNTSTIKNFCNEAILVDRGEMVAHGPTVDVVDRYVALLARVESERAPAGGTVATSKEHQALGGEGASGSLAFKEGPRLDGISGRSQREGTGEARVRKVELVDSRGQRVHFVGPDEVVTIRVHLEYLAPVDESVLVIAIRNAQGLDLFSTSTAANGAALGARLAGQRPVVDFTLKLPVAHGSYSVTTVVSGSGAKNSVVDWVGIAATFEVTPPTSGALIQGLVDLPTQVRVFD